MADEFDVCVIGAGPGGYVCALRAAQLGLRTALVDKNAALGGTCLRVGCIPSKALLHSTEFLHFMHEKAASHGILADNVRFDLAALMKRKTDVVAKMTGGINQLCKARKVTVLTGTGRLLGGGKVEVSGKEKHEISARHIVIASGSKSVELPFLKFDGETVVSSDQAIAFDTVPGKLVVVGAGAIGLELGSVWARLGSKVTVVEFLPQIAPAYDEDVAKYAERLLKKQGLTFHLGTKVSGLKKEGEKTLVTADQNGKPLEFEADKVLVAVGRAPFTEGLGLEAAGVTLDSKGRVEVDERLRTKAENVWAIGDVIAGPMLAHKAEEEGIAVAERIAGQHGHVSYDIIPNVVYTHPEIAGAGLTERLAKEKGIEVKVGKFPLGANGRAVAADAVDGFIKVIADKASDKLLGVQIVAHNGSELIAEAVAHMEYGGSAEDMGRTVHAHPTMAEAVKEAGLAVDKAAIHALKQADAAARPDVRMSHVGSSPSGRTHPRRPTRRRQRWALTAASCAHRHHRP